MVRAPMNELTPYDLQLRGRRVRYVEGGARGAPAVVMLHGIGRDHAQWSALATTLASTRRVVALDIPGFGLSEPIRGAMRWEELAETVLDLVACLELGRVTLIGHSMGAAIAIVAAADRPEFVERLVLIAPSCYRATMSMEERIDETRTEGRMSETDATSDSRLSIALDLLRSVIKHGKGATVTESSTLTVD